MGEQVTLEGWGYEIAGDQPNCGKEQKPHEESFRRLELGAL
jgi:hypothetical protein